MSARDPAKPTRRRRPRQNPATGWAFAGSQRHIQAYVNTPPLTARLNEALVGAFPVLSDSTIDWRAPLADAHYAEPRDTTFWPAIEQPELAAVARGWWPARGGPSWDAVAIARSNNGDNVVVLAEAKANVPEFGDAPCTATSRRSIDTINAALNDARRALNASAPLNAWVGSYYQLANRLTWTLWLRAHGVDTVFVHLLFEHDRSRIATPESELRAGAHAAHAALGLPADALDGWAATVVLPAT